MTSLLFGIFLLFPRYKSTNHYLIINYYINIIISLSLCVSNSSSCSTGQLRVIQELLVNYFKDGQSSVKPVNIHSTTIKQIVLYLSRLIDCFCCLRNILTSLYVMSSSSTFDSSAAINQNEQLNNLDRH